MDIKATDVKILRDKTGAGMMDCKKALQEANGDFAKAEKILKELGLAAAAKRAGRATKEGRIFIRLAGNTAACLEISCETDFVANNSDFKALGEKVLDLVFTAKPKETTKEMEDMVAETVGKIKENITIRRFKILEAGQNEFFAQYIHEGKIGVIVKCKTDNPSFADNPLIKELAFNLALHIAAFAPQFLSEAQIGPEYLKEQEEIFMKQAQATGKPTNVLAGIAKGKMKKHFSEVCLLDQGFVKDEKQTVSKVLADTAKQAGTSLGITDFVYFKMGVEL